MTNDIRLIVRNKRISIQKYSNGAYDHDAGYYEVAHIKLSKSKASFMDDIDLEEIKVMLNKLMK